MSVISNIPAALEWRVYKGDTAILSIAVKDDDCNAYDLSNYTAAGMIKADPLDEEELQDLTITITGNVISLTIDDTTDLPKTSYFDVQLTGDDKVWTVLKGMIIAENDVTR